MSTYARLGPVIAVGLLLLASSGLSAGLPGSTERLGVGGGGGGGDISRMPQGLKLLTIPAPTLCPK